ncbi:MAG: mechanosensitive ion channel [Burkholderiales bacterium]
MTPPLEHQNLLFELIARAESPSLLWQGGVIAAVFGLSWLVAGLVRARLAKARSASAPAESALRLGAGGLDRVVFPLAAWLGLVTARAIAHEFEERTGLLDVAVPLLSSLVLIRIAVYVLRHTLPEGNWLRGSERAVAWIMWIGVVFHLTGILSRLRHWLREIELPLGGTHITALGVIEGTLSVIVTMVAVLWLGRIAEERLMRLSRIDISVRVVLSKLVKAVLIVLGVLTALALVGIDITVLSVFGGALGVGLGFGLQKIAANYVSGFAILLDGSVKPGDLVTIDNRYGEVTRLTARYVVIRSLDGTEAIVPNETVITSTVVNHSYSDRQVRERCTVQVSYATDVRAALDTLVALARAHPRVLETPAPIAVVSGLADSGVNLDLYAWIRDPEAGLGNLRSELNIAILERFKTDGIEIPYPQREIRILAASQIPDTDQEVDSRTR